VVTAEPFDTVAVKVTTVPEDTKADDRAASSWSSWAG